MKFGILNTKAFLYFAAITNFELKHDKIIFIPRALAGNSKLIRSARHPAD